MRVSLPMSWPEPLPFRFCQVALYWLLGISHQDLLKPQTSAAGLSFIAGNMKKSVYYIYYCLEFNASILYEGKAFKKSSVRVRSFKSWRAWSTWRWCTTQQTWTWAKKNCDSDSLHKRKGLKHEEVFCKYLRHHLSWSHHRQCQEEDQWYSAQPSPYEEEDACYIDQDGDCLQ